VATTRYSGSQREATRPPPGQNPTLLPGEISQGFPAKRGRGSGSPAWWPESLTISPASGEDSGGLRKLEMGEDAHVKTPVSEISGQAR
jgi:hypothetical protein